MIHKIRPVVLMPGDAITVYSGNKKLAKHHATKELLINTIKISEVENEFGFNAAIVVAMGDSEEHKGAL